MSWSRHGYEKASYCISHTGRQPAMHNPIAVPRMPASASGVSTQRSTPKRSCKPAVARKTPPALPTSSPMTMTVSSRASSVCSASFTASTRRRSAIAHPRRRVDVRVVEEEPDVGIRLRLGLCDAGAHGLRRLRLDLRLEIVGEHAELPQVALVAAKALILLLFLDALEIDVGARIVRGCMRRSAIRHGLDEGR